MARTRSPDFGTIQDQILENTARLFASRGFVASSIGDIAEACACSKSRLYHYFESKEAILSAMLSEHVDRMVTAAREITGQHAAPRERLSHLVRSFMTLYAASRSQHVVLLTCMEFLPEGKRQEITDKQRELVTTVSDCLEALRSPDTSPDPMQPVDTMLFFGMINWTYTWYRANGPVDPETLADRCIDLFLNGYLATRGGLTGCAAPPPSSASSNRRKP